MTLVATLLLAPVIGVPGAPEPGPFPPLPAPAQSAAAQEEEQEHDGCEAILDVGELEPGMVGTGLTVARGTEPEPFDVEVVDILDDALAPGVPLIIVEVDSPEIDRVGGIWAGMSGSPVYIDGQLIGAIAYGFSLAPSKLGGVTPAAAMLEVSTRPARDPAIGTGDPVGAAQDPGPDTVEVELSATAQQRAREDGVSLAASRRMRPLEVPVQLSGLTGERFQQAKELIEARYPGTQVVRGPGLASARVAGTAGAAGSSASTAGTAATTADTTTADTADTTASTAATRALGTDTLVPGANLAVSLWYGDTNAVGVGTLTSVCDGVVTAFGHPMVYDGATRLGMHAASAVRVVDDATFGPYKLANAGPVLGTIGQDRLAGVAGHLGAVPPTAAVTSSITNLDDGRTVDGRTDAVWPDELFAPVLFHGWTNYDLLVLDEFLTDGTAEVAWTIEGLHADGSPWSVTRENRHASRYDISSEAIFESALSAQLLHDNPFEQVRITEVDHTATVGGPYRALQLLPTELEVADAEGEWLPAPFAVTVVPGETLRLRVGLRAYRGPLIRVEVELDVPDDVSGYGELEVAGGGFAGGMWDVWECLYYPEECGVSVTEDIDGLLEAIAGAPRGDELVVRLRLYGDDGWYEEPGWPEEDAWPGEPGWLAESGWLAAEGRLAGTGRLAENGQDLPPPAVETTVRLDEVVTGQIWREAFVEGEGWDPCPEDAVPPFIDVAADNVHASSIACATALGVTTGISEDPPLYAPSRPVRRDQAASFLVRLLDHGLRPLPDATETSFVDLEGNVHREAIERLHAAGIISGRTSTTFEPAAPVTRAQIASLLVTALQWSLHTSFEAEDGPHFSDVDGVHAANIDVAYELGLVQGRGDGTFDPGGTTRRDQMATLLVRLYHWVRA